MRSQRTLGASMNILCLKMDIEIFTDYMLVKLYAFRVAKTPYF